MAKSKAYPIFWGLFAAGGTLTAFVTPVMIFLTGLAVPLGILSPEVLAYERVHAFVGNWIVKLALFGIIFLSLWHAAHRMRITVHELGLRVDGVVALVLYGLAALLTVLAFVFLLRI
jgi:fumarate reductase subunit D